MAAPKKPKSEKRALKNFRFRPAVTARLKSLVKARKEKVKTKKEKSSINMTSVLEDLVEKAAT